MSDVTSSEPNNELDQEFNAWLEHMKRKIEATRESEVLTAEDYAIRINTIAD